MQAAAFKAIDPVTENPAVAGMLRRPGLHHNCIAASDAPTPHALTSRGAILYFVSGLASYANQADDELLHKYTVRIKARAIRRCEELLKQVEPAQGGVGKSNGGHAPVDSRKSAGAAAGLSEHQRKTAIRVATDPEADFERRVESENPPTITELAEQGKLRDESSSAVRLDQQAQYAARRLRSRCGSGLRRCQCLCRVGALLFSRRV